MVEIEGPDGGTTVPYLKDIIHQAKLYVRPLQRDISEEDMKDYSIVKVCSSQSNGGMVLSVVHILLLLCNTVYSSCRILPLSPLNLVRPAILSSLCQN